MDLMGGPYELMSGDGGSDGWHVGLLEDNRVCVSILGIFLRH